MALAISSESWNDTAAFISRLGLSSSPVLLKQRVDKAISAFENELREDNDKCLRFEALRQDRLPDSADVLRVTEQISKDCAKKHGKGRAFALRATPLLERIRYFAPIGDVVIGGAQYVVASGAWAAIRLALEVSLSFLTYFEKVSALLQRIAKATRLHKDFAVLFPEDQLLQDLACEYLAVIIDISTKIVHYSKKSGLSQAKSSLLSTFESSLAPLEAQLKDVDAQIREQAKVSAVKTSQTNHALTHRLLSAVHAIQLTSTADRSRSAQETAKHSLLAALCPNQPDFRKIYSQYKLKGHSTWLHEEALYKEWSAAKTSTCLHVCGTLGSGKSVVMASAVGDLLLSQRNPRSDIDANEPRSPTTVCYFFWASTLQPAPSASTIMGSIAYQVSESATMSSSLTQYLELDDHSIDVQSEPRACSDLLLKVTPKDWRCHIVIDGLDECPRDVVEALFEDLKYLALSRTVLLLCSYRPLSKHLDGAKSSFGSDLILNMDEVDRSDEVDAYISKNLEKWRKHDQVSLDSENLIRDQLRYGWNGMFLWLALQVEVISDDLFYGKPVVDIISNLPTDLPKAYDRAFLRIAERSLAPTVMKLVAAAESPMTVRELRVAANITPGKRDWNPVKLPEKDTLFLWRYGGHLLEMDEDDHVQFIHHSIFLHLSNQPADPEAHEFHFRLADAKQYMAAVFVTCLNLPSLYGTVATRSQPLQGTFDIAEAVAQSIMPAPLFQAALRYMPSRQLKNNQSIDVQQLITRVLASSKTPHFGPQALLKYAKANWLRLSRYLDVKERSMSTLWKNILDGRLALVSLPFDTNNPYETLRWIMTNGHHCFLQCYLSSHFLGNHDSELAFDVVDNFLAHETEIPIVGPALLPVLVRLFGGNTNLGSIYRLADRIFRPTWPQNPQHDYELSEGMVKQLRACAPRLLEVLLKWTDNKALVDCIVPYLVEWIDPGSLLYDGMKAAHFGAAQRRPSRVMELLSTPPPPPADRRMDEEKRIGGPGIHPLLLAAWHGNADYVSCLLDCGVDVETNDNQGRTALLRAMEGNRVAVVRLLLKRGASIDARDVKENTLLHAGAKRLSLDALEVLLGEASGVDVNATNSDGDTALHIAQTCLPDADNAQARDACTKFLLENGARQDTMNIRPVNESRNSIIMLPPRSSPSK